MLIAMISDLLQSLTGIAGERRKLQFGHRANTERRRRVLSIFMLGGLLLHHSDGERLTPIDLKTALSTARKQIARFHIRPG